jgi:Spy/CpxP family protein refolding chaperone
MTPAEQLKARMRLLMDVADMQNAAAAAAAADEDPGGGAAGTGAGGGWTRYVLDKHGALDEDKQAMQKLLDEQVRSLCLVEVMIDWWSLVCYSCCQQQYSCSTA